MACIIKNCKSHRGIKGTHSKYISFHKFPTDKIFLNKWIYAVARESDWTPKNYHTICSEHFSSECFTQPCVYKKHRKLTDWAVPTLHLPQNQHKNKEDDPDSGACPTILIVPMAKRCKTLPFVPKPPTKTEITNPPKDLCVNEKKTHRCYECLQYRGQIQGLKKKVNQLEQIARKRLMRINVLRQKVKYYTNIENE